MASPFPSPTPTWHNSPYPAIDPSLHPTLSASGKAIFVTGGGKCIGETIALHFARAGARAIILTGRTVSSLESCKAKIIASSPNTQVEAIAVDITNAAGIAQAFETADARFGGIDVHFNNAGYLTDEHTSVAQSTLDDYWRGFEVNIKGGVIVTQAFLQPGVAVKQGATAVNITSGASHIPYIPGYSGVSESSACNLGQRIQIMSRKAGNVKPSDDISLPAAMCVWLASSDADFRTWETAVGELGRRRDEAEETGDPGKESAYNYIA